MMKKGFVFGIIIIFLVGSFSSGFSINIKDSIKQTFQGHTLYVGGNGPGNYTNIQSAINDAVDFDTIFVYDDSSPYNERLHIYYKQITLVGENKNTTVINGSYTRDVIDIRFSDSVIITGFSITGSGKENYATAGVQVYSSNHSIYNNIFYDNRIGISLNDCYGNIIYRNSFILNSRGIWIDGADNNTIINNSFYDTGYGIYLIHDADFNFINNNIFLLNVVGIEINDGSNNCISGNNISLTINEGIGIFQDSSIENKIINNYISKNKCGIYIESGRNNLFVGNTIINNEENGIEFNGGEFNKIKYNHFGSNSIGLYLYAAEFNEIKCNNFIDNDVFLLYYRYIVFCNILGINYWKGNYWDSFDGIIKVISGKFKWVFYRWYDFDHNYYEKSITITRNNFDWFPANKPYEIPNKKFIEDCGIE